MSENKNMPGPWCPRRNPETGAFAVEFAIVLLLFLTFIFGIIEMSRAIYMFNTLQDVTRRAASAATTTNFRDIPAMDKVRQNAVFRDTPGTLLLGDPVTDAHIRIDYMAQVYDAGSSILTRIPEAAMPSCPARNRVICMANPNAPNCIRFVRVQVCEPGNTGECQPVRYRPMVSLIDLSLYLPHATTITPIETLGFVVGDSPCP